MNSALHTVLMGFVPTAICTLQNNFIPFTIDRHLWILTFVVQQEPAGSVESVLLVILYISTLGSTHAAQRGCVTLVGCSTSCLLLFLSLSSSLLSWSLTSASPQEMPTASYCMVSYLELLSSMEMILYSFLTSLI